MKKEQKMTKNQPKRSRKVHVINAVKHFDNQFKKYLVTASTAAFAFLNHIYLFYCPYNSFKMGCKNEQKS